MSSPFNTHGTGKTNSTRFGRKKRNRLNTEGRARKKFNELAKLMTVTGFARAI